MTSAGMINLENKLQSPFISELEAAKSLLLIKENIHFYAVFIYLFIYLFEEN